MSLLYNDSDSIINLHIELTPKEVMELLSINVNHLKKKQLQLGQRNALRELIEQIREEVK